MNRNLLMEFSVDKENNSIQVKREFAAPLNKVWAAWTQSELLDQWWAPKPWKARTKTMDFREGGYWLYAMVGPEGEEHWAREDYQSVNPMGSISYKSAFCDSEGNINTAFTPSNWTCTFRKGAGSSMVTIDIKFENLDDLEKIIEMGFREGFTAGLQNLEELLEKM